MNGSVEETQRPDVDRPAARIGVKRTCGVVRKENLMPPADKTMWPRLLPAAHSCCYWLELIEHLHGERGAWKTIEV
ncbi:hypothetical protein HBI26_024530 [Parastagonospora nodorum]|nr:hypothetical protein HBH51_010800 [Parastagonospora nodorum]KAH4179522.1 hypothetical protein HBH43_018460 [Parastagonospora nodorum]KAH4212955.1 hypothetical protein HBI95_021060 [Parastagonospora nodorum]KAH5430413.1 hypothetical protein HBI46_009370 [Parastagonospora nodorum]KAH5529191.1 hypothetical protein HBI29_012880 [Parastagonospora nodorum]